jgi:threonine synthase
VSISDEETLREIKRTHDRSGHILDPHTAVGVAAARLHSSSGGNVSSIIVAATAHPAKFGETIRRAIGLEIPLPPSLQEALRRTKRSTRIGSDYEQLKAILIG